MIILLSTNKDIIKSITKSMPNVIQVDDLLSCQIELSKDNLECDMLMIDWNDICHLLDVVTGVINRIIKQDLFIKHIIFYYNNLKDTADLKNLGECYHLLAKLTKSQYKANIITQEQLMKGLGNL